MADGTSKPIEQIVPGDLVLSVNHNTPDHDSPAPSRVTRFFDNGLKSVVKLIFENQKTKEQFEVVCTPSHRFYIKNKGWTTAETLHNGDLCTSANGEQITFLSRESLAEQHHVYNFEVEENHTYYVGTDHTTTLLVHNESLKCGASSFSISHFLFGCPVVERENDSKYQGRGTGRFSSVDGVSLFTGASDAAAMAEGLAGTMPIVGQAINIKTLEESNSSSARFWAWFGIGAGLFGTFSAGNVTGKIDNITESSSLGRFSKFADISSDLRNEILVATKANHGVYRCKEFAKTLVPFLKSKNIVGELITVRLSKPSYIGTVKNGKLITISQNGEHYAIKLGDTVFDNIYPEGINYTEWKKALDYNRGFDINITIGDWTNVEQLR